MRTVAIIEEEKYISHLPTEASHTETTRYNAPYNDELSTFYDLGAPRALEYGPYIESFPSIFIERLNNENK